MSKPTLYQRVSETIPTDLTDLQRAILEKWTGDWLWSVGQISSWFGVSRGKARRQWNALVKRGLVRVYRHGGGA